jgi:hypothetical protein
VLFSPHQRHDSTWGDPFNQVHAQLYLHIPYTGFRFHLLTECEDNFFHDSTSVTDFKDEQLFPIYNELKSNSQKRMNIAIGTAIGSSTLTYEVIAVFGYLTFGSRVRSTYISLTFFHLIRHPGEREHHRNVPFDLDLHRRWTTCHRDPRSFLVPVAGSAVQKLPRQGLPFRFCDRKA